MAPFLSSLERQAWLAHSRTNPALVQFARWLNDVCETALEQTGRELAVEHAAAILLRAVADAEPSEVEERLAA